MGACGKSAQLAAPHVAARRDGGARAGVGAHPRGDDGDGRVYMVARSRVIFEHSAVALEVVAWSGWRRRSSPPRSALVQTDIKLVLAYSTVSQLGYMFRGGRVGAVHAAGIFHPW